MGEWECHKSVAKGVLTHPPFLSNKHDDGINPDDKESSGRRTRASCLYCRRAFQQQRRENAP